MTVEIIVLFTNAATQVAHAILEQVIVVLLIQIQTATQVPVPQEMFVMEAGRKVVVIKMNLSVVNLAQDNVRRESV